MHPEGVVSPEEDRPAPSGTTWALPGPAPGAQDGPMRRGYADDRSLVDAGATAVRPVAPAEGPAGLLQLQRTAGNAAVTRLLATVQRSCCGGCASGAGCEREEGLPAVQRDVDQATASKNRAGDPEPLSMQPVGLRDVLTRTSKDPEGWWEGLDQKRRLALVDVYNRLSGFGVWRHVRALKRVVPGEAPWHKFEFPGLVESVEFDCFDGKSLMEDLLFTPKLCMDDQVSGALHPGQSAFRQFGTTGSLHISVGPGANDADAHVDKITPPKGKNDDYTCDMDMPASFAHLKNEVGPEKIRGKTGIPGLIVNPDDMAPSMRPGAPDDTHAPGSRDPKALMVVGAEWRFGK